jgi:tRNA/rRNA methyltransferase
MNSLPAALPAILLSQTQLQENIGFVARAMANFGLTELRLINPQCGAPNERASATASGADEILRNAKIYNDYAEAVADIQHLYACTARLRDMEKPVFSPEEAAGDIMNNSVEQSAFLFGAERSGLENEEILFAKAIIRIPVNPAFSSLNLGQSVLLCAYEYFRRYQPNANQEAIDHKEKKSPAPVGEVIDFYEHLENELQAAGFFKPPEKKPAMIRNLRNIFSRVALNEQEVRMLRGVVRSLAEK